MNILIIICLQQLSFSNYSQANLYKTLVFIIKQFYKVHLPEDFENAIKLSEVKK